MIDAFTPPGFLEPRLPEAGEAGFERDRKMIESYFNTALQNLGLAGRGDG